MNLKPNDTTNLLNTFYHSTDPLIKKECLDALQKLRTSEDDQYRALLWEKRYCKNGKFVDIDLFLNSFIELSCLEEKLTSFFSKKSAQKKMHSICSSLLLDQSLAAEQSYLLYQEFENVISIYIELCKSDKKYSSVLMGLGTLKEADLSFKIAKQLYTIVSGNARICGMEKEFSLLSKAGHDSFVRYFPNETDSWDLAQEDFEKRYHLY